MKSISNSLVFVAKHEVTAHSNNLVLAIKTGSTLKELAEADFFFKPGFD